MIHQSGAAGLRAARPVVEVPHRGVAARAPAGEAGRGVAVREVLRPATVTVEPVTLGVVERHTGVGGRLDGDRISGVSALEVSVPEVPGAEVRHPPAGLVLDVGPVTGHGEGIVRNLCRCRAHRPGLLHRGARLRAGFDGGLCLLRSQLLEARTREVEPHRFCARRDDHLVQLDVVQRALARVRLDRIDQANVGRHYVYGGGTGALTDA